MVQDKFKKCVFDSIKKKDFNKDGKTTHFDNFKKLFEENKSFFNEDITDNDEITLRYQSLFINWKNIYEYLDDFVSDNYNKLNKDARQIKTKDARQIKTSAGSRKRISKKNKKSKRKSKSMKKRR
jgi:hypothetical protein